MQPTGKGVAMNVVLLLACAAGTTPAADPDDVRWLVGYEGNTVPTGPQWMRRGGDAIEPEVVDGALRLADSTTTEMCCYRASVDVPADHEIVVEARVRVKAVSGYRRGGKGRGVPRLYRPWSTGVPVGILVCDGRSREGLVLCPGYIATFLDRFHLMDTTDVFHVYRLVICGKDMSVYVDGELRIRGNDAFWRPAGRQTAFVQFGSNSVPYTGEADWDYVKLGVRPVRSRATRDRLRITLSEPWEIPEIGGVRSTRPYLYNVGDGMLMMSVAQGPDALYEPYGVLRSTDRGRTWEAIPGLMQKIFAPQPMVRLDDGSIFGASRWTVECRNSHTDELVALTGISYRFDQRAGSFEMVESRINPGDDITRHVVFDRHIFKMPDGALLAAVYNGANGSLLLRTADRGRTWDVFAKIGQGYEPGVAFVSATEATAILRQESASPLHQVWSHDAGRTWGPPAVLEFGSVDPDVVHMSNGVLACSYGRPGCGVAFSVDQGRTWEYHRAVTELSGFNYTAISEVSPGRLLYVHDAPPLTALYVDVEMTE